MLNNSGKNPTTLIERETADNEKFSSPKDSETNIPTGHYSLNEVVQKIPKRAPLTASVVFRILIESIDRKFNKYR